MKLSVIIPVYNVVPYLRECLDSVAVAAGLAVNGEQGADDGNEVEVICVDDGSTDGSSEILDAWASSLNADSRFLIARVLHQRNAGVSAARNAGLALAHGDWVLFVDGDDVVAPGFFSEIARLGATADLLVFRLSRFWGDADYRLERRSRPFPGFWPACAYRREIVPAEGFEPLGFGEDKLFLLACLLRAKCVIDVDCLVYGYRQHVDSTVWRKPTLERFLSRRDYACRWLAMGRDLRTDGSFVTRRAKAQARREVTDDALGALSVELFKMDPPPWREWLEGLDRLAEQTDLLPWTARLQLFACLTCRRPWVTRRVIEWPYRIREKIRRTLFT